jgi:alpha-beta hydrolase superfamily lysophospholipase
MIAPLAKYIDWWAIQFVTMLLPPANGRNPRLEEAVQFLKGPDFIPAENQSRPVGIEFNPDPAKAGYFRFPTPRPGDFAENNVVYGRLYRCAERWQERPVIVLLHGGSDFINHQFRFPLIARRCNRAGLNAATLALPYHFQRHPRQLVALSRPDYLRMAEGPAFPFPASRAFSSRNYLRMAEAMAQAIAEIRALTGWLLGEGCPAVALWGFSLGGWLAGLAVCRDARLASVVLTAPGVLFDFPFGERVFRRSIREAWQGQRVALETLNLTSLNVTSAQPAIPKENILLIEGIHDLLVRKETVEELWQAWGRPDIWRLPHGHVSWMGAPGLTGRVLRWLAPRLDAPAATKTVSRGFPRNAE